MRALNKIPSALVRVLPLTLIFALPACNRRPDISQRTEAPSPTPAATAAKPAGPAVQAADLLTKEEVASVQGCTVTGAQSSNGISGQLLASQVFFSSAEPNKSVSLLVMQDDPSGATKRTAKDFWHETFDRYRESEDENDKDKKREADLEKTADKPAAATASTGNAEREEEERRNPPHHVDGLGDEAYWWGNPVGGILYILRGDKFLRISVGGPDSQETKLTKSKSLAEKALRHM